MVFFNGLNHCLNQWFKPFGLNQPTLDVTLRDMVLSFVLIIVALFFYRSFVLLIVV